MLRISRTIVFLALAGQSLNAQELEIGVVPSGNDTVTYTFDVGGPPRGQYMLFVSPNAFIDPIQLPGIGDLHLDPTFIIQLTPPRPLDPTGFGTVDFTVPIPMIYDLPLHFQALSIDPRGPVATTNLVTSWYKDDIVESAGPATANLRFRMGSGRTPNVVISGEFEGAPNKTVEITVCKNGFGNKPKVVFKGKLDANGKMTLGLGFPMSTLSDTTTVVFIGGKPAGMVTYTKSK
ncbi:MAG: hypothetical protein VX951_13170 [Planctomycetota bacterium]|nr:hypothetical protein [Planctomycetota bacterium]